MLSLLLAATVLIATPVLAADPIVGTWKLDVAKSKFTAGEELTAATRTYTESGGSYKLEQHLTGANGKETSYTVHYRAGHDTKQPMGGAVDETHATRVDAHTWDFVLKKDGKIVGKVHRVVSADGKTLTVHNSGMHVNGATGDETLVFERE